MANYDYFKQYKSEMERIKAKTAHDEHKIEFRDMCAKMINDAIPVIKEQIIAELKAEKEDFSISFQVEEAAKKLRDAIFRVFS